MTTEDLLNEYDLARRIDSSTLAQMRYAARSFSKFSGDFTSESVNAWIRHLERTGKSPSTVRTYRGAVLALWNFAVERRVLDCRPDAIRTVRVPQKNATAFSREECQRLLAEAGRLRGQFDWGPEFAKSDYWGAIIRVSWDSSLRRGDLLDGIYPDKHGLEWADIVPSQDGAMLVRAQNKTGHQAQLALSESTVESLDKIRTGGRYVFPWPRSATAFIRQFERLRDKADVRRLPFKCLRRASITDVALRDMTAAAQQAGHKPGSPVTAKAYIDWTQIAPHRQRPAPLDERESRKELAGDQQTVRAGNPRKTRHEH